MGDHFRELSEFFDSQAEEKVISLTWLNHHSLATAIRVRCRLECFTLIGIDGFFLNRLSGSVVARSSADLFLPHFFRDREVNVGIIGGTTEGLEQRREEFLRRFPKVSCKFFLDGYSNHDRHHLVSKINDLKIDVLIIGMGTPFQEYQAVNLIEISETIERKLIIFTCGAWLEQLLYKNFYPSWAYTLRLNWLVRLVRNPIKLWKRYFVESFKVWFTKRQKIEYLNSLPGYKLMQKLN